jgi:hypothetical protein
VYGRRQFNNRRRTANGAGPVCGFWLRPIQVIGTETVTGKKSMCAAEEDGSWQADEKEGAPDCWLRTLQVSILKGIKLQL